MAKIQETKWSAGIVRELRKANALVLSIHGEKMQAPGWPDVYIAHKYWTGFVEFKGPTTKIQVLQKRIIDKLRQRGTRAYVVRYPNLIQTQDGVLLAKFDEDAHNIGVSMLLSFVDFEENGRRV